MFHGDIEKTQSKPLEKSTVLVILYLYTLILTRKKRLSTLLHHLEISYASFWHFNCPRETQKIQTLHKMTVLVTLYLYILLLTWKNIWPPYLTYNKYFYNDSKNLLCPPVFHGDILQKWGFRHLDLYLRHGITLGLYHNLVHSI